MVAAWGTLWVWSLCHAHHSIRELHRVKYPKRPTPLANSLVTEESEGERAEFLRMVVIAHQLLQAKKAPLIER